MTDFGSAIRWIKLNTRMTHLMVSVSMLKPDFEGSQTRDFEAVSAP